MGNHYQPNSNIPLDGSPVRQAPANSVLSVQHLEKTYGSRGKKGRGATTRALADVSFDVNEGEFVAIMGASGSGKSTLLNCVSTIDSATSGHVFVRGVDVTSMRAGELARFRREQLGFIFQDSNLLDTLTARENIALPLTISRVSAGETLARVEEMAVIMADEPTGALDSKSARLLLESLQQLNEERGATILMVTHDSFAASYTGRVLFIRDGKIFTELRRGSSPRREFFDRIMEVVAMMGGEGSDAL